MSLHGGLLVDTNLLVLFVLGKVNPDRIERFKRTSRYTSEDFEYLITVMGRYRRLFTVPHVMAEESNLTDLENSERMLAREVLREAIELLEESPVSSRQAASGHLYGNLGLVDSAIAEAARQHGCVVLTDDFQLCVELQRKGVEAVNFTHLQAARWGI